MSWGEKQKWVSMNIGKIVAETYNFKNNFLIANYVSILQTFLKRIF